MSNPYCNLPQLFALFDERVQLQLSGDQNTQQGKMANLQFLLDMQAAELESYLDGRVALPVPFTTVPATGMASIVSIPADNSTVTIGDGISAGIFTFLSGGTGLNQVNTSTGNAWDIAALWAAAINQAGLSIVAQSRLYSVALINTSMPTKVPPSGYAGNVPITSTAGSSIVIRGMIGGTAQVSLVLTKWVGLTAVMRTFGRRADMPPAIKAGADWADSWIKLFMDARVNIPGVPPASIPLLSDSDFPSGESRWDYVYGQFPSPTGTTNTTGNVAQLGISGPIPQFP